MKKLISLLALLLVFALAACGTSQTGGSADDAGHGAEVAAAISSKGLAAPEAEPEPEDLPLYPSGSTSKYLSYATSLPEIVWTTAGEDNGLIGSIYTVVGTVTEAGEIEVTEEASVPYIIVETDSGSVMISNMYEGYRAMYEAEGMSSFFNMMIGEAGADYTLPAVGDAAEFVGVYAGFSDRMAAPSLYLGANEYIVEGLRGPEPEAEPEAEPETKTKLESKAEPEAKEEPEPEAEPAVEVTTGQRNALASAKSYLAALSFSYSGLIEQLEYEGYTYDEAVYAADNCGADWYEQAVKSAESYLAAMSFSKSGLIDQLEYEGFTYEEAVYGAEQNGY